MHQEANLEEEGEKICIFFTCKGSTEYEGNREGK